MGLITLPNHVVLWSKCNLPSSSLADEHRRRLVGLYSQLLSPLLPYSQLAMEERHCGTAVVAVSVGNVSTNSWHRI